MSTRPALALSVFSTQSSENPIHQSLLREIETYKGLSHGWDGYDAESPNPSALADLSHFLDLLPKGVDFPNITLASTGLPSLYWDDSEFFADLEFLGEGESSLYFVSKSSHEEEFVEFDDMALASEAVADAVASRVAA